MAEMNRFFPILLIIFLSSNLSFSRQQKQIGTIDSIVHDHMKIKHIPGLSIAIIKNNEVVKKGYYGNDNLEERTRVSRQTTFEIASMTKQITAAAILLLQEDGKLSVKDKLSKYLNDIPETWKDITIENLMNHTSGLRDDWNEPTDYFIQNDSYEKMAIAQQKMPLLFNPGEGFNYSSGPFFLGLVIKNITGKHYSYFLRNRIFLPLEMNSTFVYSTDSTNNLAIGYKWNSSGYLKGTYIPPSAESRADVGVVTTLDDMIKWNAALKGPQLLNSQSLNQMFSTGKLKSGQSIPYGYGWYNYYYRNKLMYVHGGAFRTGFNSRITIFPDEKLEIIILCNLWDANLSALTAEIAAKYISEYGKVSLLSTKPDKDKFRTQEFELLFTDLATKKYNIGELYQKINCSGFDIDELEEILKGFRKLEYIDMISFGSNPKTIYDTKIAKILYYKAIGDEITYWSFAISSSNKLIFITIED